MKYRLPAILFVVISAVSVSAQSPPSLHGTVTSSSGKPLAGITVRGDYVRLCCPDRVELSKTDQAGNFAFAHETDFARIRDHRFRPFTLFVKPGQTDLRVVLEDASATAWNVPACPNEKESERRVGRTLAFLLPQNAKFYKVTDGDDVSYYVTYRQEQSRLRITFGSLVEATDPDDRLEKDSSQFLERWISEPSSPQVGIDASGRSNNGRVWRHSGTFDSSADYSDATQSAAKYFDAIIKTVCVPRHGVDF